MRTISDTPINMELNYEDSSVATYIVFSNVMKNVYQRVAELSTGDDPIVIVGELGVGKQHLAKLIHSSSNFAESRFQNVHNHLIEELIRLRISAMKDIPEPESYLTIDDLGIDVHSIGTLFLDSFSDLKSFYQKKVMELLYDFMKRTSNNNSSVTFRPIFSMELSSEKELYDTPCWDNLVRYFNPAVIHIPPLRERREDISLLIDQFLFEHARKNSAPVHSISYRAAYKFISYHWPGNVQQLKNVIEYLTTIVAPGSVITNEILPFSIDWKSYSSANKYNIDQNASFTRAEKILLKKLVSKKDYTEQQLANMEHKFRFPINDS